MGDAVLHYRVRRASRIVAFGCGASGLESCLRTEDWARVTCGSCKRTKEWRAAAGQQPSDPQEKKR